MGNTVQELKRQIRQEIKKLKSSVSFQEKLTKSQNIFAQIEKMEVFQTADTILLYWSVPGEVHTHDFILKWCQKKKILLPVINDDFLELIPFTGTANMRAGKGPGIPEPTGQVFDNYEEISLALVPGVAFDKNNNRLGHGKAYYDKLLPAIKAYKAGVCFDFQLLETVPITPTDFKMDMVVSG